MREDKAASVTGDGSGIGRAMIRHRLGTLSPLFLVPLAVVLPTSCTTGPTRGALDTTTAAASASGMVRYPAVEPEAAEGTFRVQHGFRMELIAAEPLVYDPVAMVYDENGRAYVAEMSDYPYTDKATATAFDEQYDQAPIGRVRLLEDTDGDGRFDRGTIFAEGLSWPTGLGVWKGGVYVTATPDVWYLKDADGDGRADVRELAWTGFRKFNVQGVINNLTFGLDHNFYGAGASNGGVIRPGSRPGAEGIELGRSDFRFDPVRERFEVISGGARFGNSFDDWGNRFIAHVSNPVQHVVLLDHYLERNSHLSVPRALHDVAGRSADIPLYKISPPEPWRTIRARRRASDPRHTEEARKDLAGIAHWTAATGSTVYRGDAYPEEYRGNVFIGEVASNVIHRQRLSPDGVTFRSVRADPQAEFVASADTWFRGVNLVNAPDGTLHVLDMYREVVEHPWSLPEDVHAQIDLLSGTDRGRIYRLAPPGFRVPRIPRLGEASTQELVAALESANGWKRDTAHRLLYERQDRSAVEPLRRLVHGSESELARLHALWSLEGLESLREEEVLRGLSDLSAGVREHAVRLAEPRLKRSPSLLRRVLKLVDDPDPRVRFQVAFTLGEVEGPGATAGLVRIAWRDGGDPWVRTAVLSSAAERSGPMLLELMEHVEYARSEAGREMLGALAVVVGAGNRTEELDRVLDRLADMGVAAAAKRAVVRGVAEGLERSGATLRAMLPRLSPPAAGSVRDALDEARRQALDGALPAAARAAAVQLLSYGNIDPSLLAPLLAPGEPTDVQMATVRALSRPPSPAASRVMLSAWGTLTPLLRAEVEDALVARAERARLFLAAVEAGEVPLAQVSAATRARLMEHEDTAIVAHASALFSRRSSTREEVVERYRAALSLAPVPARGREVYLRACSSCHRLGDTGFAVGPDLESVRHKTPEQLLALILDPDREVSPEYVLYRILMKNGSSAEGMIASETPNGITLRRPGGVEQIILRQNIAKMTSSGASLMPEGLEGAIGPQDMADLIAFLRSAADPR